MTPDVAWAAGFLDALTSDGRGRIAINSKKSESPRVVVVLEDREPLAKLERLFGGKLGNVRIHNQGKPKTVFRWDIRGARACHMLVEILPGLHLQNKRARAALYYSWYDTGTPSLWRRLFTRKRLH